MELIKAFVEKLNNKNEDFTLKIENVKYLDNYEELAKKFIEKEY